MSSLMTCRDKTRIIFSRITKESVIKTTIHNLVMGQHSKSQLLQEPPAKRYFHAQTLARSTSSISTAWGTLKQCRYRAKVLALLRKILPGTWSRNKLAADCKLLQALLLSKTRTKDLWSAQERQLWRTPNASLLVCFLRESLPSTIPTEAQCASQTPSTRETVPWNLSVKMKTKTWSLTGNWNHTSQVLKKPLSRLLLCSSRSPSTTLLWFRMEI